MGVFFQRMLRSRRASSKLCSEQHHVVPRLVHSLLADELNTCSSLRCKTFQDKDNVKGTERAPENNNRQAEPCLLNWID